MSSDPLSTESTQTTETPAWQATDSASEPGGAASVPQRALALANDRPETAVGAAFAGGLVLAMILKRLAR